MGASRYYTQGYLERNILVLELNILVLDITDYTLPDSLRATTIGVSPISTLDRTLRPDELFYCPGLWNLQINSNIATLRLNFFDLI